VLDFPMKSETSLLGKSIGGRPAPNATSGSVIFFDLEAVSRFALLSFARSSQKDIRCNRG